jgi:hypothetical protein
MRSGVRVGRISDTGAQQQQIAVTGAHGGVRIHPPNLSGPLPLARAAGENIDAWTCRRDPIAAVCPENGSSVFSIPEISDRFRKIAAFSEIEAAISARRVHLHCNAAGTLPKQFPAA